MQRFVHKSRQTLLIFLISSLVANVLFLIDRIMGRPGAIYDEDGEELQMGRTFHHQAAVHFQNQQLAHNIGPQCIVNFGNGTCSEAYPTFHSHRLTHVVMPFHTSQVSRVEQNLRLWNNYLPCGLSGARPASPYHLILYSSADARKRNYIAELEGRLQSAISNLSSEALSCFQSVEIHHANLSGSSDTYYKGTRLMIEKLIVGKVKMTHAPQYVFYMEPDCYPIRSNWLNALDTSVRWPHTPFWMKGSIYRGYNKGVYVTRHPPQYYHINGNALYHVGDRQFRAWYIRHYRPFVQAVAPRKDRSFDTDFWRYIYDLDNVMVARQIMHKFQYTEVVMNYWKSSYSVAKLRENYPATYLVHGGYQKP